jgi:hypothetical protein
MSADCTPPCHPHRDDHHPDCALVKGRVQSQKRRKIPGYPRWVAYMTLGQPYRLERWDVKVPVRVVLHRRRAMLWAVISGRVRVRRG